MTTALIVAVFAVLVAGVVAFTFAGAPLRDDWLEADERRAA